MNHEEKGTWGGGGKRGVQKFIPGYLDLFSLSPRSIKPRSKLIPMKFLAERKKEDKIKSKE